MSNSKAFAKNKQSGTVTPGTDLTIVTSNTQTGGSALTHTLTSVPAGALIVVTTGNQQSQTNCSLSSTPSLTWTKRADATSPLSPNAEIWTAVHSAGGNLSVVVNWGLNTQTSVCYVLTGHEIALGGASATAVNQSEASVPITSTKTNSIVFCVSSNWNAPELPITYRLTPVQALAHRDVLNGTWGHYYYTFPTVAAYTVGYTSPNDIDNGTSTAVLEVRSSTGGSGGNTAPSAPILSSPNHGTNSVELAWTAATDDVGIESYEIYVNNVLNSTVSSVILSTTVPGLNTNTTYNFKVRAKDTPGLGTDSNTISITTNDVLPGGTPFTFTALTSDYRRYWGGPEYWGGNDLAVNTGYTAAHRYRRFVWNDWEGSPAGTYRFTDNFGNGLKTFLDACITQKQLASFGIMTCYPGFDSGNSFHTRTVFDGVGAAYPTYLHTLMQGETIKDWNNGDTWVPNFNSTNYISRFTALIQALNSFLNTNHSSGIKYGYAVGYIDLRGMGAYGEWHSAGIVSENVSEYPGFAWTTSGGQKIITSYGAFPTPASLIQIIDAQRNNLPDWPLTTILNSLDGNFPNGGTGQFSGYYGTGFINTAIPVSVGQYIMNNGNAWGPIGRRRDQWGDTNNYYSTVSEQTNAITGIPTRWQTAPINGEPPGYAVPSPCNSSTMMQAFPQQAITQHASIVGNSNYGGCTPSSGAMQTAFTSMGCILRPTGGSTNLTASNLQITVNWRNLGVAPQYKKNWQVTFELRATANGSLVWSGNSSFNPFLFLPSSTSTAVVDSFTRPSLGAGTYQLSVIIKDSNNYLEPLQLGIQGRQTNGSYILANLTF